MRWECIDEGEEECVARGGRGDALGGEGGECIEGGWAGKGEGGRGRGGGKSSPPERAGPNGPVERSERDLLPPSPSPHATNQPGSGSCLWTIARREERGGEETRDGRLEKVERRERGERSERTERGEAERNNNHNRNLQHLALSLSLSRLCLSSLAVSLFRFRNF